ncbi:unnamed protein product [Sordaria macrospora k-hell]|uniref:WGS project CABT00000000 data, contig 2.2 n=1 Tax=Sordaria macrospora (strain ATCC MYA-333 / DSM 997 / K(L3346) / K-hell) TaxID=771870 RepID=F7VNL9_SORMK|nr:uncharacterized protein SMAC_00986 [Sordaria macrospora k-hell]CCC06948.1 unnamed protein product [Sordaria macrospora k-hell]
MYQPQYGYNPNPAAGAGAGNSAFNGAPPPQNPQNSQVPQVPQVPQQASHLQPSPSRGPSPSQQQQRQQQQRQQQQQHHQQMINSNSQPATATATEQFHMGSQAGGSHFPAAAAPSPGMMGTGAGPAGMMQNAAMPHTTAATNGQMSFQAPYTSAPYVAAVPSPAAPQPQLPANYMMSASMPHYPMNAAMSQQQPMMQRIHPSQQNAANMSASTPQRSFNPASQGTPNNAMPSQQPGTYSTAQGQGGSANQTPTTTQPQSGSAVVTPQTPTFPSTGGQGQANGTPMHSAPQSPTTRSREQERFAVLLEINHELLYELACLHISRQEIKREKEAAGESGEQQQNGGMSLHEEEKLTEQDYQQCMVRVRTNMGFMAPLSQPGKQPNMHPYPAYLTPPPLHLNLRVRVAQNTSAEDSASDAPPDPNTDRAERHKIMTDLYKKLQSLYPALDYKNEPIWRSAPNASAGSSGLPGSGPMPGGTPDQMSQQAGQQQQSQQSQQQQGQQQNPQQQHGQQQQQPGQQLSHQQMMMLKQQQYREQMHQKQLQIQQQIQQQQNGQLGGGGVRSNHGSPAPSGQMLQQGMKTPQMTPQMSNAVPPGMVTQHQQQQQQPQSQQQPQQQQNQRYAQSQSNASGPP